MSKAPCGCYHGGPCTRSTLCAVQAVEEDRDERIRELEAQLETATTLLERVHVMRVHRSTNLDAEVREFLTHAGKDCE